MIDITGYDFSPISEYVFSQYFGVSSLADKMSAIEGGISPFEAIAPLIPDLDKFIESLSEGLERKEVLKKLANEIQRSD